MTIRPGQLGAFIRSSVKRNLEAVRRGVRNGLIRGKALLSKDGPVDQGILKGAWKVVASSGGMPMLLNDAPHAGIVERGARPHMPPLEPILEWVKRHLRSFGLQAPRWKNPKEGPLRNEGAYSRREAKLHAHMAKTAEFEDDVLALAEAIRWKIAKQGLPATYFVRSNLPKLRDLVHEEIERALEKALKGEGD